MSRHTSGPWTARHSLTRWNVTTATKPRTFNICTINSELIEQEANARLIAAAPAMLAALQAIASHDLVFISGPGRIVAEEMKRSAIAAIAKAEEKQP